MEHIDTIPKKIATVVVIMGVFLAGFFFFAFSSMTGFAVANPSVSSNYNYFAGISIIAVAVCVMLAKYKLKQ